MPPYGPIVLNRAAREHHGWFVAVAAALAMYRWGGSLAMRPNPVRCSRVLGDSAPPTPTLTSRTSLLGCERRPSLNRGRQRAARHALWRCSPVDDLSAETSCSDERQSRFRRAAGFRSRRLSSVQRPITLAGFEMITNVARDAVIFLVGMRAFAGRHRGATRRTAPLWSSSSESGPPGLCTSDLGLTSSAREARAIERADMLRVGPLAQT